MAHLGIMIVASEADAAADLRDRLKPLGCRIVGSADSCREARDRLDRIPADVVLVVTRPDQGDAGPAIAAEIRNSHSLPVIVLVPGAADPASESSAGADDAPILRMPFEDEEFRSAVEAAVSGADVMRRLKVCEERFHQLTEGIREIMILYDMTSRQVLFVNSMYEEIFGRSCDSLYQDGGSFLEFVYPEDRESLGGVLDEMLEQEVRQDVEFRIVRPDGGICWLSLRGFPFRSQSNAAPRLTPDCQGYHPAQTGRNRPS